MRNLLLCLLNTALLICGQLLFKFAAQGRNLSSPMDWISLALNPYMITAILLYGLTTLLWVYILTKIPISFAYPIQAMAFPLVLMLSVVFFREEISVGRWVGIGVIILGVFVVGRS